MLNRKHKISHQKNNVDILSFTEAITVELLSPVAEPPHWAHLSGPFFFFFFFNPIPAFGPTEMKRIHLTCTLVLAICIIIMLLILTQYLKVYPTDLFLQLSLCAVWLEYRWIRLSGLGAWVGLDVVGCQWKDIHLIQITNKIAVSVYKVVKALEKCFPLVRKSVWIKLLAVGYIVYGTLYLACNWLELWCTDDVLLKSEASNAMILGYSFCIFILV